METSHFSPKSSLKFFGAKQIPGFLNIQVINGAHAPSEATRILAEVDKSMISGGGRSDRFLAYTIRLYDFFGCKIS